ncbi:hypothetical protein B0H13DRAFT_2263991 [Mycena leptocephala]|nr:hypothetical protein B0H13DRAFT_2263991 [Mycena leptocephala]
METGNDSPPLRTTILGSFLGRGRPRNSSQSHIDIPRELSPSPPHPHTHANAQPTSPNPYNMIVQGGGGPGGGAPGRSHRGRAAPSPTTNPPSATPAGLSLGHMLRRRRSAGNIPQQQQGHAGPAPMVPPTPGGRAPAPMSAAIASSGLVAANGNANSNTNGNGGGGNGPSHRIRLVPHLDSRRSLRPAHRALHRQVEPGTRGGERTEHEQDCVQEQGCESGACGGVDRGCWCKWGSRRRSRRTEVLHTGHEEQQWDVLETCAAYFGEYGRATLRWQLSTTHVVSIYTHRSSFPLFSPTLSLYTVLHPPSYPPSCSLTPTAAHPQPSSPSQSARHSSSPYSHAFRYKCLRPHHPGFRWVLRFCDTSVWRLGLFGGDFGFSLVFYGGGEEMGSGRREERQVRRTRLRCVAGMRSDSRCALQPNCGGASVQRKSACAEGRWAEYAAGVGRRTNRAT